ncbi:hypothetical protein BUH_5827, partial [Burkholderia pseudomallei Pakistan 9]
MGHVRAVDVGERAHRRRPVRSVECGACTARAARASGAGCIDGSRPRRPALDPAFIATIRRSSRLHEAKTHRVDVALIAAMAARAA